MTYPFTVVYRHLGRIGIGKEWFGGDERGWVFGEVKSA
jgi:hypothetical protein